MLLFRHLQTGRRDRDSGLILENDFVNGWFEPFDLLIGEHDFGLEADSFGHHGHPQSQYGDSTSDKLQDMAIAFAQHDINATRSQSASDSAILPIASSAAAMMCSMSCSVRAMLTNAASNWLHGR